MPSEEIYIILYMLSLFQNNKSYPVIRMWYYVNLTNSRLMMILVLFFMRFFRFSELSSLKRSDFTLHNTHMSIFIENIKTSTGKKTVFIYPNLIQTYVC